MFVLALEVDLHIGHAQSLKDKRSVVRSILEGAQRRFGVSAAEVGHQQLWQRTALGFAVVAATEGLATKVMDDVERFVYDSGEVEVLSADRSWLE